ncbi:MAG: lytic transglycosylase domain-containing protein [Gammaproteobacteria bacterium]
MIVALPALNWTYQVVRKPTELFFPVSDRLYKTPTETWRAYAPIFRAHATDLMTPSLLAGLAQAEASGNPVARTYWRWSARAAPLEMYKPASSAVGMYQITDGTFEEARQYCIHDHRVVQAGRWYDLRACWFNALYLRVLPSHAVELTSANLDRRVREILARRGIRHATLRQRQDLAIVTHLCGAGAAARFAAQGLRVRPGQRCGDHDLAHYLAKVHALAGRFAQLARAPG